jgi:flagellum-specific peptidoglycan hydrolase FlgJ
VFAINRYLNKRISVYVFTVALLLAVGSYFETSFSSFAATSPVPSPESTPREELGAMVKQPSPTIWTSPIQMTLEDQHKSPKITKAADEVSEPAPQPHPEPAKPTSKVISKSGLSEVHIAELFKGTALSGQALEEPILEIEDKYGINAYFTIAIIKLESGHGKSRLAKHKNNLFGLNAIDGDAFDMAMDFPTKADCVREFGRIIAKGYLDKGYTTVDKVAGKYCSANTRWARLVKSIMRTDYRKAVDLSV